jgi:hypothetical protein
MKKQTIVAMALCGMAGFAVAASAAAKDEVSQGGPVDFYVSVNATREVPAGNPLPGLHIDANVKGRMTDIYIAPMSFVNRYEVKVSRGDEVHIVGTETNSGNADVVLAREITRGKYNRGVFHPEMTHYLRNNDGPFWEDNSQVQAH